MSGKGQALPLRRFNVKSTLSELEFYEKNPGKLLGIPTGYERLDAYLGGLCNNRLVLFVARPGVGKTTLALNVILNAINYGKRVVFFSMEMHESERIKRLAAIMCGIPEIAIRTGHFFAGGRMEPLQPDHYAAFRQAMMKVQEMPIGLHVGGTTTDDVWATMEQVGDRTDLVVMDHVGLFTDSGSLSQYQRMTYVSRALKDMRLHFGQPMIAVAQLNRATEGSMRKDPRPGMADIRDTGALEQDADQIVALWREDYQSHEETVGDSKTELLVLKNRYGPTGTIYVHMSLATGRIYDRWN